MSEKMRAFVAFDLANDSVVNRIAAAQKMIIQTNAEIAPDMIDKVYEVMKNIKYTPFNIQLTGMGVFPTVNYPRVVWAGITDGAQQLKSIFEQLEIQLHDLGFKPEPEGFKPHLTIARVRSGANKQRLVDLVERQGNYDFGNIRGDCLRLKKSVLSPKGPTYTTLKEYCP